MPIDPEAIARFLDAPPRRVLPLKGAPEAKLRAMIKKATGEDYQPKTQPYAHQVEALTLSLVRQQAVLFLEMRLGKTKVALDWAEHLRRSWLWHYKGLVIVPSPVLLHVWQAEAALHSHLKTAVVEKGIDAFTDALESDADLLIVSWSGLQTIFSGKRMVKSRNGARNKMLPNEAALRDAGKFFQLVIVDELHTCKNWRSLRFQMGAALAWNCRYRLGLTGTPFGRNPFDLWAQAYLIDEGRTLGKNYFFFAQAFGRQVPNRFTRSGVEWVFDEQKLPKLLGKLEPISLSYRLAECRELPEVCRGIVELEMTREQKRLYNQAIRQAHEIGDDAAGQRAVRNIFVRLRQIAAGHVPFVDDQGAAGIAPLPHNPKLEWLAEFFAEMPPEAKVVLFHEFTYTGKLLCNLVAQAGIKYTWLYGETKDKDGALQAFRTGDAQVLIANTASGGVGIDLQMADYQCFVETPVSPIVRAQAEARALGPGRAGRALFMDDLVCAPIEERILGFLREGRDLLQEIVFAGSAGRKLLLADE
jgi:superfamily II DNA or RNA helicase